MTVHYKIKRIAASFPNPWHIVNTKTNVTQSMWGSYEDALNAMRDLNAHERCKAKEAGKDFQVTEPLRLVINN